METKKWEYDKMINQYKDTENQEFDNSLNFIKPVYYRIDPDTGEKFFKYNEPPQYNLELHGFKTHLNLMLLGEILKMLTNQMKLILIPMKLFRLLCIIG